MLQASSFECLSFNPFSFQQDDLIAPEVDEVDGSCSTGAALRHSAFVIDRCEQMEPPS